VLALLVALLIAWSRPKGWVTDVIMVVFVLIICLQLDTVDKERVKHDAKKKAEAKLATSGDFE
jgi:uncharacterized membrane protein